MSETNPEPEATPAAGPPNQAAPGPHPHEAADIRSIAGDVSGEADPMEGYADAEAHLEGPDTSTAQSGPHPHEAADVSAGGGLIAGYEDPLKGRREGDDPAGGAPGSRTQL